MIHLSWIHYNFVCEVGFYRSKFIYSSRDTTSYQESLIVTFLANHNQCGNEILYFINGGVYDGNGNENTRRTFLEYGLPILHNVCSCIVDYDVFI